MTFFFQAWRRPLAEEEVKSLLLNLNQQNLNQQSLKSNPRLSQFKNQRNPRSLALLDWNPKK